MVDTLSAKDRSASNRGARESWEASEISFDLALLDGGYIPPLPRPQRITDLQHWIDLNA
jgi:hypothetical protein